MATHRRYWLMKSEPDECSIEDLERDGRVSWFGVRGYQARNYMRDEMHEGDLVVFYHSSAKEIGPAGIARVASLPYPDPTQFARSSPYFDPKSRKGDPRWVMVDVAFVEKFPKILTRERMKGEGSLSRMMLWSHARLSIMPLTKKEFDAIARLARKR